MVTPGGRVFQILGPVTSILLAPVSVRILAIIIQFCVRIVLFLAPWTIKNFLYHDNTSNLYFYIIFSYLSFNIICVTWANFLAPSMSSFAPKCCSFCNLCIIIEFMVPHIRMQ